MTLLVAATAALLLCGYFVLIVFGSARASAAPSAPSFLGESEAQEYGGQLAGVGVEASSGEMYVGDSGHVIKLSPYGDPELTFGHHVDATKVHEREAQESAGEPVTVTPEEEDICTVASGDQCASGSDEGGVAGAISGAQGVAVEPSSGNVYVVDRYNTRVDEFTSSGKFILTFGGDVNKVGAERVKATEEAGETPSAAEVQAADICAAGEACQEGRGGGGEGAFEGWPQTGSLIAVGGSAEEVYVAGKGRVQVFNSSGEVQEEISLASLSATGSVTALAVDGSGEVFLAQEGVEGVHEIEPAGTLSTTVYDESATKVGSIALDGSGHLFVADEEPTFRVLEYEVATPSGAPVEFADSEPGEAYGSAGIAVDRAGTVDLIGRGVYKRISGEYVHEGESAILLYGSLPAMESAFGAPPLNKPVITGESVSGTPLEGNASVQGFINPEFRQASYQFEYGLQPCSQGGCTKTPATPAALGAVTKGPHQVTANLIGLQLERVYHYRLVASNAAGEGEGTERLLTIAGSIGAGPTGLPDGRVYEQVTPAFKNGNFFDALSGITFGLASANGNAVVYPMSGPVGQAYTGLVDEYVSHRVPGSGWVTRSTTPRQTSPAEIFDAPLAMIPSASFEKFVFQSQAPFVAEDPLYGYYSGVNIFLSENPAVEPIWIGRPTISNPLPGVGAVGVNDYVITGQSPELNTVYFAYKGTLTAQDAEREQYAKLGYKGGSSPASRSDTPWGFYEWSAGKLVSAGALPDGSFSPWGAVPSSFAGLTNFDRDEKDLQAHNIDNEVSEDGSRAFFVSPDPAASTVTDAANCETEPPCTKEAPELYVREPGPSGSKVSVLISRSEMPGHEGEPAPTGVARMQGFQNLGRGNGTDAFPTPDGTHVFFSSTSQLTPAAPSNKAAKIYEYDMATEATRYLPEVTGSVVAVAKDGSELLFVSGSEREYRLSLWQAGSGGGTVTAIAELPGFGREEEIDSEHFSADGSSVVFRTSSEIPGGFNNGGGYAEIYRYSVSEGKLSCLSCAPKGQEDIGNAHMSYNNNEEGKPNGYNATPVSTIEARGISANGDRVFFDTPNALVPQDTNGVSDVYEWENGTVYLISSGSSAEESLYLANDETGENVFFATSQGLVPGDTDEAYDVYDARIPRPGDNPPPAALPCKGSICQGPPSVPQLLSPPASETFSGPGNPPPPKKPVHTRHRKAHKGRHQRHKRRHHKHKRNHHGHNGRRHRGHKSKHRRRSRHKHHRRHYARRARHHAGRRHRQHASSTHHRKGRGK